MVSKVNLYMCDLCKKEYLKEDKATKCEESHYRAIEVEPVNHVKTKYDSLGIPNMLRVKLRNKDGKEVWKVYEIS